MSSRPASPAQSAVKPDSLWQRFQSAFTGLIQDFWKDPVDLKHHERKKGAGGKHQNNNPFSETLAEATSADEGAGADDLALWHADRVQILERMWGDGFITPGGAAIVDLLTEGVSLDKGDAVLDLSCGLGGADRHLVDKYGVVVTGLEADQLLAKRGTMMAMASGKARVASVGMYDPETFTSPRSYKFVFAQELFCRIIGKTRFFREVASSVDVKDGVLCFTDYILEESAHERPDIAAWLSARRTASPATLAEMADAWAAHNFHVTHVDETERILKIMMHSFASLTQFLTDHRPDKPTKMLVLKEIEHWARHMAALKAGLRYMRFTAKRKALGN